MLISSDSVFQQQHLCIPVVATVQRPLKALRGRTLTHSGKSFKSLPSSQNYCGIFFDIKVHLSTGCIQTFSHTHDLYDLLVLPAQTMLTHTSYHCCKLQ